MLVDEVNEDPVETGELVPLSAVVALDDPVMAPAGQSADLDRFHSSSSLGSGGGGLPLASTSRPPGLGRVWATTGPHSSRPIGGIWARGGLPSAPVDMALVSRVRRAFRTGQARALREEAGLSIRELAAYAGLPRASLQNWETGTSLPRPEGALAWANAMKRLGFKV
jgi:DNA-binding XRE family transcriptional regulator